MDTISLTREEYEAMIERLEDLEDTLAFIQFEQNLDQAIPNDVIEAKIAGIIRPTVNGGLSQRALAKKSGVNHVQIGDIEGRGKTGLSPQ